MNKVITTGTLGLAGLVAAGLVAWQAPAFAGSGAERDSAFKRNEDGQVLVTTVDDDDDDDTDDRTRTRTRTNGATNTGNSRSRADHTNSRVSAVSRDRDLSRGDRTRDWTTDGPGKQKRDWSANSTNDRSRNDTRR